MDKKVLFVSGFIVLLAGFFAYEKFTASPASQQVQTPIISNNQNTASSSPATTQTNGLKDGTYTGQATSSIYGPAQVQIVVSSGKITDVQFLQYPSDRSASLNKSQYAMPIIKQEVIQAQSANVNTVSGATQTSASFIQSIASAVSQAS